ncbi:MAG TPA: glycosyltransferase family 4 protein, partial [Gemmatimonadaceae bacterium]
KSVRVSQLLLASAPHAMSQTVFTIVSFEGTDRYSQAGGLGVRVSGLARTLAALDYETHLFFVGDPTLPGEERASSNRLVLHRWAQWISANCPGGVYEAEEEKVSDFTRSIPEYLIDRVIRPALADGKMPVVLFEEWQTAECASAFSALLTAEGLRDRVVVFWTANNSYGFERINWRRLAECTTVTTISRYMRSIIRSHGADAQVIPNGIPAELLKPVPRAEHAPLAQVLRGESRTRLFFKMARWEREKGWHQALGAVAELRARGRSPLLVARSGGPSITAEGLHGAAAACGLRVKDVNDEAALTEQILASPRRGVDVLNLRFAVSTSLARTLFAVADGVLANSIYEPFGLVGLEAMAAGGMIYTGGTGEDYAVDGRNAVVLETLEPLEIARRWEELNDAPARATRIRRAARSTAKDYSWERIVAVLIERVASQAAKQGLTKSSRLRFTTPAWSAPRNVFVSA